MRSRPTHLFVACLHTAIGPTSKGRKPRCLADRFGLVEIATVDSQPPSIIVDRAAPSGARPLVAWLHPATPTPSAGAANDTQPASWPAGFLLSVVIPAYNEQETIAQVIERVRACGLPCEIIVVDDGSTDRTGAVLDALSPGGDLCVVHQPSNQGKGAALRLGFQLARGSVVLVQDADLEYDPAEYDGLIRPIVNGEADVVFGSRYLPGASRREGFCHWLGNRVLTLLSNALTHLRLSDMETGYKVFRGDLIRRLAPALRECRFGIEPEITAKVARIQGVRICERPIHYQARSYAEGKKIGWRDAVASLWCIFRYARG